jgi:nitrite reductase/ring-hydroxylating ferredoxin subunit
VNLGPIAALRARLPLVVRFDGKPFRIVALDGALAAHAAICPHRLGPLVDCVVEDGAIRCPWHGYRYDVVSGRSRDGRRLRLPPAPRVVVDPSTGDVLLTPPD